MTETGEGPDDRDKLLVVSYAVTVDVAQMGSVTVEASDAVDGPCLAYPPAVGKSPPAPSVDVEVLPRPEKGMAVFVSCVVSFKNNATS